MDSSFEEQIKSSNLPVVIDFWAPWCAPCNSMKPALDKVMEEFQDQVQVIQVNTDEQYEVSQELNVSSIPTLVGFYQGKEIARRVGSMSQKDIHTFFIAVLKGEPITGIDARNRNLRLLAAAALFVLAFMNGLNWLVLILAIGMLIFALYDKLPFYEKLKEWVKSKKKTE
jgi:thioredoxin 1